MSSIVPKELKMYFEEKDFERYPIVNIPQSFEDERGLILNLADGSIGDVALITSKPHSTRANHYHKKDWHLTYMLTGAMIYSWRPLHQNIWEDVQVESGQMVFTPAMIAHKMTFPVASDFIAISAFSRLSKNYESDTVRL